MEPPSGDTIAAIATGSGRGAVGIVRVSGPATQGIAYAVLGRVPAPRLATRAAFLDSGGQVLDDCLALFFPRPHSYTGDDLVEFHAHGNPVVLRSMLDRCIELGARLADPGEFTKRAFLAGKLDLSEAEAVADIIEASSVEAARAAVRALRGEVSAQLRAIDQGLLDARATIEASLDFPEDDVGAVAIARARIQMEELRHALRQAWEGAQRARLLREGVTVVLVGAPNVGKSSLFNRLAAEEIAIVSEAPGTTRDVLRAEISIDSVLFRLSDTAGMRPAFDAVEQIGIARAKAVASAADIVILVTDGREVPHETAVRTDDWGVDGPVVIHVRNKCDLDQGDESAEGWDDQQPGTLRVSAVSGFGIDTLKDRLLVSVGWSGLGAVDAVFSVQTRHLGSLERALDSLTAAAHVAADSPELMADELRLAHDSLGEILGRRVPDDVLGEVFARFCIGK